MIYNRKKILELVLTIPETNTEECSRKIFGDTKQFGSCSDDCKKCVEENFEKHYKAICESNDVFCYNCEDIQKVIKTLDEDSCGDCKKKVMNYISEDFREVFTKLGDRNV